MADLPWYPGKLVREEIVPYIERKIIVYSKKFKGYDRRIVDGVAVCYKHSPLFRRHIDSPNFGETKGWRITHLWTRNEKGYDELSLIGPLDLGLYSVRIDGILGEADIKKFVKEARRCAAFKKYIYATQRFILKLIASGDAHWLRSRLENASLDRAVDLCAKVSQTFRRVLSEGRGDGWEIVSLWSAGFDEIKPLRRIYPLDVGLYCVRLDSVIYNIDLTEFSKAAEQEEAFLLFPNEVLKFAAALG